DYFKHGYFTEARRSKKTLEGMKYLKWVPQIAAVTGARLNEILQPYPPHEAAVLQPLPAVWG
ncbi:hypothetical protein, partial [Vibrio cholerae]|uniref:hypothetical protein n=1 Tax=Vibrio cholerae TaxID=666 RepID=UPI0011250EFA